MVAARDGKVWVTCDIPDKLLLVDPSTRAVEAAYDCPSHGPHILTLTPDGTRIYVSCKEGPVAVFDIAARKFVGTISVGGPGMVRKGNGSGSEGVAPTPDGRHLLVIDNDRSDIHVIDIAQGREIDHVALVGNAFSNVKRSRLAKLMFSPDGRHLIVSGLAGGMAWHLDAGDYRKQTQIPVAKDRGHALRT